MRECLAVVFSLLVCYQNTLLHVLAMMNDGLWMHVESCRRRRRKKKKNKWLYHCLEDCTFVMDRTIMLDVPRR